MLKVNDRAPDFRLADQNGVFHQLSDFGGKWLLLYFYPKDFTSGCTREACSFRDNFSNLKEKIQIVGISGDKVASHKNFSDKYKLPFSILADPDKKTIKDYGANGLIFAKRTSFLISPQGIIEKIFSKVNPASHIQEILALVKNVVY